MDKELKRIKDMLEEPSVPLDSSLVFTTKWEGELPTGPVNKCTLIDKNWSYGIHNAPYKHGWRVIVPNESCDLDSLLMVKKFVPPAKLAYFDIRDCFYRLNSNVLPEAIRQMSLRELHLDEWHFKIQPRRGLLASFDMCRWFSKVVITENPFVEACMVDDCFCLEENVQAAKEWFTMRGCEINDKACKPALRRALNAKMYSLPTECSICCIECTFASITCPNCLVCQECYYESNKTLSIATASQCPTCNEKVHLGWLFTRLGQEKFHLPSIDRYHKDPTDSIAFDVSLEAQKLFPKFSNLFCILCKSKNVFVIDDMQIYKCCDCCKYFCPTCEVVPFEKHVCECPIGRCPMCHTFIEKTAGCNHITCLVCACEFLYRTNTFVSDFWIDSRLLYTGNIIWHPDQTMEGLMTIVAQLPKGRNLFGTLAKILPFGGGGPS